MYCKIIGIDELPEVERISKGVYSFNGHSLDYLPQMFLHWGASSNRYVIGLYVNDKLVAAKCISVFDFGKTSYHQALRVSSDQRNQRYTPTLMELSKPIAQSVNSKYPIQRERFAKRSLDDDIDKFVNVEKSRNNELLCLLTTCIGFLNQTIIDKFLSISSDNEKCEISIISSKEAWKIAQEKPQLFPSNSIFTDWDAHELSYENFLILETGGDGQFVLILLNSTTLN